MSDVKYIPDVYKAPRRTPTNAVELLSKKHWIENRHHDLAEHVEWLRRNGYLIPAWVLKELTEHVEYLRGHFNK